MSHSLILAMLNLALDISAPNLHLDKEMGHFVRISSPQRVYVVRPLLVIPEG